MTCFIFSIYKIVHLSMFGEDKILETCPLQSLQADYSYKLWDRYYEF